MSCVGGGAPKLVEIDVELIMAQIQGNIQAALSDVSNDRARQLSSMPLPKEYFFYDHVSGYRPPSVFVVPTTMDMRLERGQNFIDGLTRVNVTVLVEDKTVETLTLIAWRYQAALFQVLNAKHLSTQDGTVKIVVKVERADFSPVYTDAQEKNNPQGMFRMEVLLSCAVEHYEALP